MNGTIKHEGISREKFLAYEEVRQSGVTNMWDVKAVSVLSEGKLTEDDCRDIMRQYAVYAKRYLPN